MGPSSGHQLLQSDNIGLFGFDAPWAQEVLLKTLTSSVPSDLVAQSVEQR